MYLPISLNIKEKGDRCNWLRNVTGKKRDLELAIKEGSSMGGLYMSLCARASALCARASALCARADGGQKYKYTNNLTS